ncbi:MAG: alpha/beta hydrolase [Patescibacteria group bacterium]
MQIKIEQAKIKDIAIAYRTLGSLDKAKKYLLVLHGWNTTGAKIWENFINQFEAVSSTDELCIIALDMPGFALSSPPKTVWSPAQYAEFVVDFLVHLRIKDYSKVSLLGHSFGGGVCSILAANYSFQKLFLVAPAIVRDQSNSSKKTIQKITKFAKRIVKSKWIKKLWYQIIGSQDYLNSTGIMKDIFRVVVTTDLQAYLKRISIPTLIIWGDRDTYTPIEQAAVIQKQLKNSKLIVFPGINHGVHIHSHYQLYKTVIDNY